MVSFAALLKLDRFNAWIARQNHAAASAGAVDRGWAGLLVMVAVLIGLATWSPGAPGFFGMHPLGAALCAVPAFAVAAVLHRLRGPGDALPRRWWVAYAAASLSVELIGAGFVAFSHTPGAWIFAALLLYAGGFHGWTGRLGADTPWFFVAQVALVVGVALVSPYPGTRVALLLLAPALAYCTWMAGTMGNRQYESELERERLRAAIQAQSLDAAASRAARLEETLVGVLGQGHDAGNTVMTAVLEIDRLRYLAERQDPMPRDVLVPGLDRLREAMHRLAEQAARLRDVGSHGLDERDPVDAAALLRAAVDGLRTRHGHVAFELALPVDSLVLRICGGAASLRRMLDNLLLNACQGDGVRGAGRVRAGLALDELRGLARLVVDDDGPGFAADQLASAITAFATRKPNGTGLGLFTTERLAAASGGVLVRGSSELGGARVELVFALADADRMPVASGG